MLFIVLEIILLVVLIISYNKFKDISVLLWIITFLICTPINYSMAATLTKTFPHDTRIKHIVINTLSDSQINSKHLKIVYKNNVNNRYGIYKLIYSNYFISVFPTSEYILYLPRIVKDF